ncbi:MAG: LysR family transcriptional regulator [Pseudomonadota bacterium]
MISWSDIQLVLAIHEEGGHSAAADRLGSSQPTVSRRLRALETRMGQPVFVGAKRSAELTPLGALIVANARGMQNGAASIQRAIEDSGHGVAGEVRIAASDGVGSDWLPAALAPLLLDHPALSVSVELGLAAANILSGEADLALRWRRPGAQQSLIARRVARVGAGIYAAPSYLERAGRPVSCEGLADHTAVDWNVTVGMRWPQGADGATFKPGRAAVKFGTPVGHLKAIELGLGLGVTTHRLAQRATVALTRVLPDHEAFLDLWLVSHEGLKRSRALRTVFDHLADAVARDRKHLEQGAPSVFLDRGGMSAISQGPG